MRHEFRAAETYPKRKEGSEIKNAATHILNGIDCIAEFDLSFIAVCLALLTTATPSGCSSISQWAGQSLRRMAEKDV